jgi:hypothetical protein
VNSMKEPELLTALCWIADWLSCLYTQDKESFSSKNGGKFNQLWPSCHGF